MSLDVYLNIDRTVRSVCPKCIHEFAQVVSTDDEVFEANITHNLGLMASKAGIYEYLWTPEKLGIEFARGIIEPLEQGLKDMIARPSYYKEFDADNGWGVYEDFVPWIEKYLAACKENPDARIRASR